MMNFFSKKSVLWARVFARLTDYSLIYLTGVFLSFLSPLGAGTLFNLLLGILTPLLCVPLEAFCLSTWGTTPGKALFQLSIRDDKGKKLSFLKALKRALFLPNRPGNLLQSSQSWKGRVVAFGVLLMAIFCSMEAIVVKDFSFGFEQLERNRAWVHYSSQEAGFKVDFPTNPELESKKLPLPSSEKSLNYNEYTSATKHAQYSLSYLDFPSKWRWLGTKTLLKKAVDLIVQNTGGGNIWEKELTNHKSYPAIDFSYIQGKEEVRGRLVIVGNRLFKLTVTNPSSVAEYKLQRDVFVGSFDLVEKS